MPDRGRRPTVGLLAAALAKLALCSCATKRLAEIDAPPETATPVEQAPTLDALYASLDDASETYRDGIDLIVSGREVDGEERITSATGIIDAVGERCAKLDGCDFGRVLATLDRLLTEQGIALKRQALRVDELVAEAEEQEELPREPGTSPFGAVMPEIGRAESLLRGTDLREIITLNGPVQAALDDWLTWMRPLLMSSYENYQFLRSEIAPIYEEAGLPEALLFAMMATETGGKVHSYSRAGAAGPLQFMRRTGRRYGLRTVDGFDQRLDPTAATKANVAYLNERFEEFNDSLEKALAAYNGGESRIKRLHRKTRGASFWDSKVYYSLPTETREYVPRILAAAWLFLHPERYNLEFPKLETERATLLLKQEIALGELTVCLGQSQNLNGWFRTLRNLNPELNPGDRIEAGEEIEIPASLVPVYEAQCLEGGDFLETARALHDANYPDEPEMIPYVVKRRDTLGRIAARHRCTSIGELAAINNVRPPRYVIRVGQTLKIPTCN